MRARRPLVHCLTSPVSANLTANALICLGASPLMAEAEAEVTLVAADALLVNLGMPTPGRMAAAIVAIEAAEVAGRPWVLDPVAAGALATRTALAQEMARHGPALIKGNASEILALAGAQFAGRGADTVHETGDALGAAGALARSRATVVVVTGAVDHVTDGAQVVALTGGHPVMARVSGLGCVAGAVAAACLAVEADRLAAACHALAIMADAGERAGAVAGGPGSFVPAFLDALAAL